MGASGAGARRHLLVCGEERELTDHGSEIRAVDLLEKRRSRAPALKVITSAESGRVVPRGDV